MKKDIEILRKLIIAGARVYRADEKQAIELLEKYLPKVDTKSNKILFYKLVDAIGQPKTVKYTSQRSVKLRQRLKTFSSEDLLKVAIMVTENEFLMGDNPAGRKYGTIDYLLRNDEMIDNLLAENNNNNKDVDLRSLKF